MSADPKQDSFGFGAPLPLFLNRVNFVRNKDNFSFKRRTGHSRHALKSWMSNFALGRLRSGWLETGQPAAQHHLERGSLCSINTKEEITGVS